MLRSELEQTKINYKTLKKSYDEVSVHVKNNATDMEKVAEMRADFEKQIIELTLSKHELELNLTDTKAKFDKFKTENKVKNKEI